jgi:mRNA-degrading endonuclease RelE of RelBE toxin-antitoxin system
MEKDAVFQLRIPSPTLRKWKAFAKSQGKTLSAMLRQVAENFDSPKAATQAKPPRKRDSGRSRAKG